jgi:hypothetical protein
MNRHIPALLAAASFSFLGFFGYHQDQEYGDLTGALNRTIAQSAPPYHATTDSAQIRTDSGAPAGPDAPAAANPSTAAEQTPVVNP